MFNALSDLIYGSNGTFLVIGKTGSGKSSLLNFLHNYDVIVARKFHDVKNYVEDEAVVAEIIHRTIKTGESITRSCKSSSLKSLSFIDTPGLADTRGINQDFQNLALIFRALENAKAIKGIIVVVNGGESRLGNDMKYCMMELMKYVPKKFQKHIIYVITRSEDESTTQMHKALRDEKFLFTNELFFIENVFSTIFNYGENNINFDNLNAKKKRRLEEDIVSCEIFAKKFVEALKNIQGEMNISEMLQLREISDQIQMLVHEALLSSEALTAHTQELEALEQKIRVNSLKMSDSSDYETTTTCKIWKVDKVDYTNTCCRICHGNCHRKCKVPGYVDKCRAFNRPHISSICHGCKHPQADHFHTTSLWREETRTITNLNKQLKQIYDDSKSQKEKDEAAQKLVQKEKDVAEVKKREKAKEVQILFGKLENISLAPCFAVFCMVKLEVMAQNYKAAKDIGTKQDIKQIANGILLVCGETNTLPPEDLKMYKLYFEL